MPKKNAFFYFMIEYKKQEEAKGRKFRGLAEVTPLAGKIWEKMDAKQREPYIQQANVANNRDNAGKLNSLGIKISEIDKQLHAKAEKVQTIKNLIAERVKSAESRHALEKEVLYVISVAYFGRTLEGEYIPAEMGVVKYCLKDGVMDRMHMYINPGEIPVGAAYSVYKHTNDTHQLPLPPNARGTKSSDEIAQCLLKFISAEEEIPPLFTDEETLPIVESMLRKMLRNHIKSEMLYVCPLSELFCKLKQATERHSMNKSTFPSVLMAQHILKMDCYGHAVGISCDHHEEKFILLHCALSQATRWAYIISKYCCLDMGIECIPGKHIPVPLDDPQSGVSIYADESQSFTNGKNPVLKQEEPHAICSDEKMKMETLSVSKKESQSCTNGSNLVPKQAKPHDICADETLVMKLKTSSPKEESQSCTNGNNLVLKQVKPHDICSDEILLRKMETLSVSKEESQTDVVTSTADSNLMVSKVFKEGLPCCGRGRKFLKNLKMMKRK